MPPAQDLRTREASRSELADAGVAGGLAQLLAARFPDQRMMREHGRLRPPEQPAQSDLTAGGLEQILPPDDQMHLLPQVVHGHRELIGPLTPPVPEEHISALDRGVLRLGPESCVLEPLDARLDLEAHPAFRALPQTARPAAAAIPGLLVEDVALG
jgi:hypothetical protein